MQRFFSDEDPRAMTLHGVGHASATALPDLDNCTEVEFFAFCAVAMHDAATRTRIAASDRHVWTLVNKVLSLAAELDSTSKALSAQQGQAAAYRDAYQREADQVIEHGKRAGLLAGLNAQAASDYLKVCDAAQESDRQRVAARDCVRSMSRQLADALTELSAKDAELELMRSFDRASRSNTGMSAMRLSTHLSVPEPAESFGSERMWLAAGTNPSNETVVLDDPDVAVPR